MKLYVYAALALLVGLGVYFTYDTGFDAGFNQATTEYQTSAAEVAQAFQLQMAIMRDRHAKKLQQARQIAQQARRNTFTKTQRYLDTNESFKTYYNTPVHADAVRLIFGGD